MPWDSIRLTLSRIGTRWRVAAAATCLLLAGVSALTGRVGRAPARAPAAVVVAARELGAGHRLRAGDLRLSHRVRGITGTVSSPRRLLGRLLAGAVLRDEPVTVTRLLDNGLTRGLAAGSAAVPVDVGTDVRGVVRAGGRVDLLAVARRDELPDESPPDGATDRAPRAIRLAGRVLVLAVLPPDAGGGGCRLVLALHRDEAVRISGARSVGVFQVVALPP